MTHAAAAYITSIILPMDRGRDTANDRGDKIMDALACSQR